MSKFTTEVRWICETFASRSNPDIDLDVASPTEIITAAAPQVFNFKFPMYDEGYRLPLEVKILRHFYTREIGEETVALWKLRLEDRLNIIMPYYNELYKSALLKFNPLYDVDYTKEGRRSGTGTTENSTSEHIVTNNSEERTENRTAAQDSVTNANASKQNEAESTSTKNENYEGDGTSTNHRTNLFSDTPQGSLEIFGIETPPQPTVEGNSWLTTAEITNDNGTTHSESDTQSSINTQDESSENSSATTVKNDNLTSDVQENKSADGSSNRTQSDSGVNTSVDEYIETVRGKMPGASFSKLIKEFRETLLNIDKMIIGELDDLFFALWS